MEELDDYALALVAAGAKVHDYRAFGSYQGDWWARITLADGRTGWVHGSYGSCSGCDAFQCEFDDSYGKGKCSDHEYESASDPSCEACVRGRADYEKRLAAFGAKYLDELLTPEAAEKEAARNIDWDSDAQLMVDFIRRTEELARV